MWLGELTNTPLGTMWVAYGDMGLVGVSLWPDVARFTAHMHRLTGITPSYAPEQVTAVTDQLTAYFNKTRTEFDLPIAWNLLTPFQAKVLQAVTGVAYGRVRSYLEIAQQLGQPQAVRAVGRANATNPMPIIIPCHRILGRDGQLHGYSAPGGLETKAWLLRHEGSWLL